MTFEALEAGKACRVAWTGNVFSLPYMYTLNYALARHPCSTSSINPFPGRYLHANYFFPSRTFASYRVWRLEKARARCAVGFDFLERLAAHLCFDHTASAVLNYKAHYCYNAKGARLLLEVLEPQKVTRTGQS